MTENLREKAAQEGQEGGPDTESVLMVVEVSARDSKGRVAQYRILREAMAADVAKAWKVIRAKR